MNVPWIKRPSPAFVVAMIALFVGLGGTAGAVATQAVPLAKRALVAENAKKLGGQTSAQLTTRAVQQAVRQASAAPGPASTASGLIVVKTQTGQIPAGGGAPFQVVCDAGQKVMGGGFSSDQLVLGLDSYPSNDTTWSLFLANLNETAPANLSVYATCLR
jgi:hypothetical protein